MIRRNHRYQDVLVTTLTPIVRAIRPEVEFLRFSLLSEWHAWGGERVVLALNLSAPLQGIEANHF